MSFIVYDGTATPLSAQTIVKDAISLENMHVGTHYTQEQLLQAFGTPSKTKAPDKFDEHLNSYVFYYGQDMVYWIDGEFYGFDIWTPTFTVNGLLRVGDSISKIDLLNGIKRYKTTSLSKIVRWRPEEDGGGLYDWLTLDFYYDDNGIIQSITAFINDL